MSAPEAPTADAPIAPCLASVEPVANPFGSIKIRPQHLDRLAIVYVRQSTPHQVLANRESAEMQYALARRAVALGWPEERVLYPSGERRVGPWRVTAARGRRRGPEAAHEKARTVGHGTGLGVVGSMATRRSPVRVAVSDRVACGDAPWLGRLRSRDALIDVVGFGRSSDRAADLSKPRQLSLPASG